MMNYTKFGCWDLFYKPVQPVSPLQIVQLVSVNGATGCHVSKLLKMSPTLCNWLHELCNDNANIIAIQ